MDGFDASSTILANVSVRQQRRADRYRVEVLTHSSVLVSADVFDSGRVQQLHATTILDYDIKKGTTYWYYQGTPVFPFGHGLSYSTFKYENLAVSGAGVSMSTSVNVSVDVTNTGTRAGDEVVQLYVAYPQSTTLPRPRQQLRGFKRVTLMPGQKQTVTFPLAGSALTYWDTTAKAFALEQGTVQIQVGSTSKDIRLMGNLNVTP